MSDLVPVPIVDKNGKHTTVHKRLHNQIKSVRAAVVQIRSFSNEEPETVSFEEALNIAREVDPDAKVLVKEGKTFIRVDDGNLDIEVPWTLSDELPGIFKGTYAESALAQKDETYGDELHRWADAHSIYSYTPTPVIAAYYNIEANKMALKREWIEKKAAKLGVRNPNEIMNAIVQYEKENGLTKTLGLKNLPGILPEEIELFEEHVSQTPNTEIRKYIDKENKVWFDFIDSCESY